jgi:hypothetical protein
MASQRTAYPEYRVEHSKAKWDPRTIEIRTHSVEKALEPLVQQVSCEVLFKHVLTTFALRT